MSRTPIEIRNVEIERAWVGGYRRWDVDELLDDIADSLAEVVRERDELSARVEALTAEAASRRELERLLGLTLVSAEQAAQEMKDQARRESDLIVREAHAESRRLARETAAEKRRLEEELIGIRARLRAALETLGEPVDDLSAKEREETSAPATAAIGEALESGIRKVVA